MAHAKAIRVPVVTTTTLLDMVRKRITRSQKAAGARPTAQRPEGVTLTDASLMTDDEVIQWAILDAAQRVDGDPLFVDLDKVQS